MSQISTESQQGILEIEQQRLTEIADICKRILKNTESVLSDFPAYRTYISGGVPIIGAEDVYPDFDRNIARFDSQTRGDLDALINAISEPDYHLYCYMGQAAYNDHVDEHDSKILGIRAEYRHGKIFVFLPVLPPKGQRFRYDSAIKKYMISNPYSHSYSSAVNRAMGKCYETIPMKDVKKFSKKIVSYFFISSSKDKQKMDSDNYDTKAITDAITGWLPGGDSALSCAFNCKTVVEPGLPEGTFVVVSPANAIYDTTDLSLLTDFFTASQITPAI